jgi:hypothetical protein
LQPKLGAEGGAVWKSPYEVFHTYVAHRKGLPVVAVKLEIAHLRVFGCKAYAMTARTQEGQRKKSKFEPKAWIGFLVGYDAVGIY